MAAAGSTGDDRDLTELLFRCGQGNQAAMARYYVLTSPLMAAIVGRRLGAGLPVETQLVAIYVSIWLQAGQFAASHRSPWAWMLMLLTQLSEPVPPPGLP